ncbi:MAG TPA: alpha/beta hydrolase [Acholeplasmataceae bacterium]|jgi:pimeloyl-ACP methyl ester carboxylesterase|nr:alpha/beta hydrolase [Acholeplasmataceae bacterium]
MIRAIAIENRRGLTIRGYLNRPDDYNGTLVVYFHGFTGNLTEHGGMFRDFSRLIAAHGFASLRCDFTGNGESDGAFRDFTYDTLVEDAEAILDHARTLDKKETVLLGFSMGGAVAAYEAARRAEEIDRLLLWSPAGNLSKLIKTRYEKAPKLTNGNVDYPNFELSQALYESLSQYDWHSGLENYHKPVKIVHGRLDQAVDYLEAYRYHGLFPNASLTIIENAGHGYDTRASREQLFAISLEFLRGRRV